MTPLYVGAFVGTLILTFLVWRCARTPNSALPAAGNDRSRRPVHSSSRDMDAPQNARRAYFSADSGLYSLHETLVLRRILERDAARYAAERFSSGDVAPEDIEELDRLLELLTSSAKAGDNEATNRSDFNLHNKIVQLSGNRDIIEQYQTIREKIFLYMKITISFHKNFEEIAPRHEDLVAVIRQGQVDLAEQKAREHNVRDGDRLEEMLDLLGGISYREAREKLPGLCFSESAELTEKDLNDFMSFMSRLEQEDMSERDKVLFIGSALQRAVGHKRLETAVTELLRAWVPLAPGQSN